jgi:hypothetical protein
MVNICDPKAEGHLEPAVNSAGPTEIFAGSPENPERSGNVGTHLAIVSAQNLFFFLFPLEFPILFALMSGTGGSGLYRCNLQEFKIGQYRFMIQLVFSNFYNSPPHCQSPGISLKIALISSSLKVPA